MPSPKRFRSSSCPYLGLNNLEKNPAGTLDLLSFNSSEIKDCFGCAKKTHFMTSHVKFIQNGLYLPIPEFCAYL